MKVRNMVEKYYGENQPVKNQQLNLSLFPPITSPSVRDIQIATNGIDLFDRVKVIEAVSKCYRVDIMNMLANTKGIKEFAVQCYEDALVANSAYNPDKGV